MRRRGCCDYNHRMKGLASFLAGSLAIQLMLLSSCPGQGTIAPSAGLRRASAAPVAEAKPVIRPLDSRKFKLNIPAPETGKVTPDSSADSNVMPDYTTRQFYDERIEQLNSEDIYDQQGALRAMARLGWGAEDAVPRVLQLMESPDRRTAEQAIRTLVQIAPRHGADYADRLTFLLGRNDDLIVTAAAESLGEMGPRAACATEELCRQFTRDHPMIQEEAVEALRRIDPQRLMNYVPELKGLLKNGGNTMQRKAAAYSLQLVGAVRQPPGPPEINAARAALKPPFPRLGTGMTIKIESEVGGLIPIPEPPDRLEALDPRLHDVPDILYDIALSDQPLDLRVQCIDSISAYGHFADYRVRSLLPLLRDQDRQLRSSAAACIACVAKPSSLKLEDWRAIMEVDSREAHCGICCGLATQPEMAEKLIPELIRIMRSEEIASFDDVRDPGMQAAELLCRLPSLPEESRSALANFAEANCGMVSQIPYERDLSPLAPYAQEVLPELSRNIQSSIESGGSSTYMRYLAELDPDGRHILQPLINLLHTGADFDDRGIAAEALGKIQRCPPEGLEALIASLEQDPDEMVRTMACSALARHAAPYPEAVAALARYASLCHGYELFNAAGSVMAVGEQSPEAAASIIKILSAAGENSRPTYEVVAARLSKNDQDAAALLEQALSRNSSSWLLAFAIEEAGERGPAAARCIPQLQSLSTGSQGDLIWPAFCALSQIDGPAAADGLDEMQALLFGGSKMARLQSAWMIGRLGAEGQTAQADLQNVLFAVDTDLRITAAISLADLQHSAVNQH